MYRRLAAPRIRVVLIAVIVSAGMAVSAFAKMPPRSAYAQQATIDALTTKTNQLQAEIDANTQKVAELSATANTLQSKLDQLAIEINLANQEIQLTETSIAALQQKLIETQTELERQRELLKTSMRALYKKGGASTVELLVASDSFSDFMDSQEYLERLKAGIQDSTKKVIELKQQITDQKLQQQALLEKQQQQRTVLAEKQREQQVLLDQTKGQETAYQALVDDLRKQRDAAEAELREFLSRQTFVSMGRILRGQMLGQMGSTGYSTGPHVHFTVVVNGEYTNPRPYLESGQFGWPAPESSWSSVSQEFGCVAPADWYVTKCGGNRSFHTGLDIAGWYSEPIVAAADGDIIFRGCRAGLGYVVIINHGNGIQTYYPHMTTPSGQTTGYCSE